MRILPARGWSRRADLRILRAMRRRVPVDAFRRLQVFRGQAGLTQEVVARRASITAKYLSEVENGHRNPTFTVFVRIVERGLGLTLGSFFASDDAGRELREIEALLSGRPAVTRRRAVRVVRAMLED